MELDDQGAARMPQKLTQPRQLSDFKPAVSPAAANSQQPELRSSGCSETAQDQAADERLLPVPPRATRAGVQT